MPSPDPDRRLPPAARVPSPDPDRRLPPAARVPSPDPDRRLPPAARVPSPDPDRRLPPAARVPSPQELLAPSELHVPVGPWANWAMGAACAGGSGYARIHVRDPRVAASAGAFSLAYLFAGGLVAGGHPRLGHDLGTVLSLGLLGAAVPTARATFDAPYAVAMSAAGGLSMYANFLKSYLLRRQGQQEREQGAK
ncbi:hypothetical protein HYH03_012770 [Edaphochlamys debaryana]|uniref:Uncharacterized protein n=1 Tax=Edaphochlamys debaryana TaxID=47281 RepID=A0A836BV79_9CHLO|nr:hypothetical protein HYH03_012770 [Edaphochlamys debaryana]|eukprot:KAG2488773.1 hypothetical protein HYH03_012770 [Edaphochlamys debaryana]